MEQEETFVVGLENIETNDVKFGIKLFDLFSNLDALKIFLYAEKGIENSRQAMEYLKLTPKRYYSRLKELIELDIIKKEGKKYIYTAFGKTLNRIGSYLLYLVKNKERLEMINDILKRENLKTSDILKFVKIIFDDSNESKFILSLLTDLKISTKMEKILTYEKLVSILSKNIDSAENSILLASRYLDVRISERIVRAMRKGLDVKIIISKENLRDKLLKFRLILSPDLLREILGLITTVDLNKYIKEYDLFYSFCIIDDLKCLFEFPKIGEDEFSIAFYLLDKEVSRRFTKLFYDIWENARPTLSFEIFKKTL